jgi:predicted XRE-type DNA-binding protein
MSKEKIEVEKSSGNIFRDLEIPDPEEHLAKCRLVFIMDDIITKRRLRRSKAAKILGIRKSELSDLLDGLFRDFSMTALLSMLEKLNHEIEVVVHQKPTDTLLTKPHISTPTGNLRRDSVTGT